MAIIYKVEKKKNWEEEKKNQNYNGSEIDKKDGFIHFSTKEQLQETLEKHYQGQKGLILIAVLSEELGEDLKWEPAREGALFPHLFAP